MLGMLSICEYLEVLRTAMIGLSLMLSPHPSYPPLEMAAFGLKVVTNRFGPKDLSVYGSAIEAVDALTPEQLAAAIARATAYWSSSEDATAQPDFNFEAAFSSDASVEILVREVASTVSRCLGYNTSSKLDRLELISKPGKAPIYIRVSRGTEHYRLASREFDDFRFQSGDRLCVEPIEDAAVLLRTPDGHYHIPIGDDVGIRVPPEINLVSFKGFEIPEHLINLTGAGFETFETIGKAHIANYTRFMGLPPGMVFLEVGCGIGRDAFQLLDILGREGRYIGIDVQRESIKWCQNNITRRYPNFEFYHFNAHHELHNPLGVRRTTDLPFRYPTGRSIV
jgi:hypothetical protein